jgi:excisionase family DNA binding protein
MSLTAPAYSRLSPLNVRAEAATMAELVLRQLCHATADTSIPMSVYPNSGNSHDPRRSCPMQADNPPVAHPRRKLRPATRTAYARANLEAGAISREQAAVHLGVGCSTLEKLAACGEGPFCFRVGNLVRYPVSELEAWKRANDARQAHTQQNDGVSGTASQHSGLWGWPPSPCTQE